MAKLKNQEKALAALIATNTIKDAAKQAELCEQTLYRYLRDPDFLAEFRERAKALYNASTARIAQSTERAVYVLKRNLECDRPSVEVRAAEVLLNSAAKRVETDEILKRLEALENANNPTD